MDAGRRVKSMGVSNAFRTCGPRVHGCGTVTERVGVWLPVRCNTTALGHLEHAEGECLTVRQEVGVSHPLAKGGCLTSPSRRNE